MTDPDLIAKKLAFIETRLRELSTLARIDLIRDDLKEERFVEHTLQLAIQAALDVASHIVSDERLGEPAHGYQDIDLAVVVDAVQNRLGDLAAFADVIRRRLEGGATGPGSPPLP